MLFDNVSKTKEQGNMGVGMAIAYFTLKSYTVSVPLTDSQEYDLVVDIEGSLKKVQVKTSNRKTTNGGYEVSLRSSGGNKTSHTYKKFDTSEVDYVFILLGDKRMFFIPTSKMNSKSTLTIGNSNIYEEYMVRI
ncbi:group I intron-associated PD-(D/E)XK endonuclease [Bacillus anthracis]|uniref:group I intron-associated PD-(D/E)XK endonuclease n=1 Tax=Bacillus anthracis TaxID=1392 RepID=UPI000D350E9D|nr:group I intron-associated PD-(D/E)XK endonuclease [Bacillus anthracis]PTR88676.1 hypothetical protein DBA57_30660 [Bacillus anthracis]